MLSVIEHPRAAVSEYLAGAADSVLAAQYKLTDAGLLGSLRALLRRGIEVRLLLDGREASDRGSLWRPLAREGAEIRFWPSERRGKLHAKFTIIDGSRVLTGSNNWTTKGLDENVEVVMALEDSTFVTEFESFFQRLWSEGEPAPDAKE